MGLWSSIKKTVKKVALPVAGAALGAVTGGAGTALLGAAAGLAANSASKSAKQQNAAAAAQNELVAANNAEAIRQYDENVALQREFAQNGIRWKVEDGKAAGLHPLAALGVSGASYTPVTTASLSNSYASPVADNSMANFFQTMGQNVQRGVEAKMTKQERMLEYANRATQLMHQQVQVDDNHRKTNAEINYLDALTLNALAAPSRGQVPSMPAGPNRMPGQGDSDNVTLGEPKFQFLKNPDGTWDLLPGNDWSQIYEDKGPGIEALPLIYSYGRDWYARLTGEKIGGKKWNWSKWGYVDAPKVVPKKATGRISVSFPSKPGYVYSSKLR